MLRSYLIAALRNLYKHKLFSAINVLGLALGLGVSLVVIGHISYEMTFEDCHQNRDRIFRVNNTYTSGDTLIYTSKSWPALGADAAGFSATDQTIAGPAPA